MDFLTPETLGLLFAVGLLAGFVDSIAGGGGLLAIPALLAAGLPPAETLATGKLQSSFGSLSATIKFIQRGEVNPRAMLPMIACTFVGAAAGSTVVQLLNPSFMRDVIPILLIGIALYLLLSPKAGELDAHQRIGEHAFALSIGTGIGFYDGFFGPGTGTFFALAFVSLLGHNFRRATAHTKILNLTSNLAALLFFIIGGHLVWIVGILMGIGQYIGAQVGAHMVIRNGARIVRPMLVTASIAITVKLVWSDESNILRVAFSSLIGLFG
ncbi:TSUP family transporter [Azospirillum griseum]|uniref:Probable membrane transporter protein n=1 Tax=Azospirillum griseum TaxID=2496639 RepID=A0A431VJK1_9PROT|nr:TSUP family transporter [Azospirillum griseum]RTR20671.1 hypothetical protein EJ903_11210 [Azospirillum griseum]